MHANLRSLPDALLTHLGAYSRLDTLERLPQFTATAMKAEALREGRNSRPYHFNIPRQGLSLMLQCMNPEALAEEQVWGLQGFTLKASEWSGSWPAGLNAAEATSNDLVALLAGKAEEVMNMPPMVCFGIQGAAGQAWSVMAVFHSSGKLDTFSILRVGPWRELQTLTL